MRIHHALAIVLLGCSLGCVGKQPPKSDKAKTEAKAAAQPADGPHPGLLDPTKATETAPDLFKVKFETTKGDVVLEIHRDWAPNGADRFYNLVRVGFFEHVAFFRAMKGFMVQFGMSGTPDVQKAWNAHPLQDDPVKESNKPGYITFAKKGTPNSRTTQMFINYGNNANLDGMGFAPFGKVVEGMDVVNNLYTGYGEGAPRGKGPNQMLIERQGNTYLEKDFPELDWLEKATILED
ncbi:MAG: peptidylprolyl isomerase [Myxococcota bacterium]